MKPRKIVGLVYLLCILCCPIRCCTAEPSVVTSLQEQYCLEGYDPVYMLISFDWSMYFACWDKVLFYCHSPSTYQLFWEALVLRILYVCSINSSPMKNIKALQRICDHYSYAHILFICSLCFSHPVMANVKSLFDLWTVVPGGMMMSEKEKFKALLSMVNIQF